MRSRLLLHVSCLFFFIPWALAQEAGQDAGNDLAKGRSLRIACVKIVPDAPDTLWMATKTKSKTKFTEVPLSTRSPGQPISIKAGQLKVLLGEKTDEPERPIKPIAAVKVPAHVKRGIVLLIPNGKTAGIRYHSHVIDEADYKYGDVYLLNLTTKPFQVRLGSKKLNLLKGKSQIYRPDDKQNPVNMPVQIFCKFSNTNHAAEKWRLITASTWRLRPTRKEFCVFYWDTEMNRPRIKALTAFPPLEP